MDYGRAQSIKKQGLSSLIVDNLLEGQGITSSFGSAISDKTKATFTNIQRSFDPLNLAKKLTGGSRLAPALLGRLTGRKQSTIEHFAGRSKPSAKGVNFETGGALDNTQITDVLGLIYRELQRAEEDRKLELDLNQNKLEEQDQEEQSRNDALIRAITGRKKEEVKRARDARGRFTKKPKPVEPAKPAPKEVPKPTPKPTAAPTKPPTPTAGKVSTGAIIGAVAVAGTAALVGKEALASNISKYESGKAGYNAYNKGTVGNKMIPSDKPIDFSKMTISEFLRRGELKQGDPDRLFAVGKYQIIPPTMKDLVKQLKIDPNTTYLDPTTQDLLFTNGLVGQRRKKVDDYVKGRSDDKDGAILELAKEFASVGVPYDMKVGNKQLKKGDSYYSGQGGNKAHNPPEQVGLALDADRLKNMQGNKSTEIPAVVVGDKISSKSVENKELKKVEPTPPAPINVNNTNITETTSGTSKPETKKEDDRPAIIKKRRG